MRCPKGLLILGLVAGFASFCGPSRARRELPGARARLRDASEADMPWIVSTVLSMVMSPIGLEKANFMVAEEDGERLGFGQLRALEEDAALLASLFVEPDARGRGVGTELVQGLLLSGRARRRTYALTLRPRRRFFLRLGFAEATAPPALALEAALGRLVAPLVAKEELLVLAKRG